LEHWNTNAVTGSSMSTMFRNATAFNQPLTFNTAAVTNMSSMFRGAHHFNQPLTF
jgi:surface protein